MTFDDAFLDVLRRGCGADAVLVAAGKQARAANDDSSRAKQDKHQHASIRAATAEPTQSLKQKKIPTDSIAKIVAEENANKSKFPHYPGLERWELIEKMGDGAFSNVYRAHDCEGDYGEVAIKVVRKYEMSSQQVRGDDSHFFGDFIYLTQTRGFVKTV